MLIETLLVVVLVFAAVAWTRHAASPLSRKERVVVWLSLVAHLVSGVVLLTLYRTVYSSQSDVYGYLSDGRMLAGLLREDFSHYWIKVLKLLFQQDHGLPLRVRGSYSTNWGVPATGSMRAITGIISYCCIDRVLPVTFSFGLASFSGKIALYRAFRDLSPKNAGVFAALGCLMVPSLVFWTAAPLKEAVAVAGLGWGTWGLVQLLNNPKPRALLMAATGLMFAALIKAYVVLALVAGIAVYWTVDRTLKRYGTFRVAPLRIAFIAVVGVLALIAMGRLFPRYEMTQLLEEADSTRAAQLREISASKYQLTQSERFGVLDLPLAFVTALFRPFLFEVRNPMMLVSAAETSLFLLLFIRLLYLNGLRGVFRRTVESPLYSLCLTYTLSFAIPVSMATSNLGTLTRYRGPMLPFFTCWLLLLLRDAIRDKRKGIRAPVLRRRPAANTPQPRTRPSAIAPKA